METSHPVLSFPVYGLAESAEGPRWLDGVEGPLGSPVTGVWLGHGSTTRNARRPWMRVGTFRRDRFPGAAVDADERMASRAVLAVVDATMPNPAHWPDGCGRRLLDVASTRAGSHTEWPRVSWIIDDRSVSASVLNWAGAWAAFTTALPEVDVLVIGFGVEPDDVALAQVRDSSAYHFDLGQPVTFPDTVDHARAAAGVRSNLATDDEWWPAHADHTATV